MAYVTSRTEDIGRVDYTVSRYMAGYSIVAYQAESGITATYRGKGNVWERLKRGVAPNVVTDPRLVWRLAELAAELDESEKAS